MKKGTLEWMNYAERDFEAARVLRDSYNPPYEIIGYHCQQSAEKYLKALLIEYGQPVPFIHDLGKLNLECRKVLPVLSEIQNYCERLTPFGTVTRYPGSSMIVGSEHMSSVVAWSKEVRDIIREHLQSK